ncbi:MAG TPA: BTAD domain-containing putative transcriptional regulator [Ktedonobacteraceae bacterium]|nr:BTAD domain-containing putative transcriptional regulator [Ktedonobacteraceae bacterium]
MKDEWHEVHAKARKPGPQYRAWLCGPFRLERRVGEGYEPVGQREWGGHTSPRTVLKALLCAPGRQMRRSALAAELWPEATEVQASREMSVALTFLRKVLRSNHGEEVLTEEGTKGLKLAGQDLLWNDADAASLLLDQAEQIGVYSPAALSLLEEALNYFERGLFLEDDEGEWAQAQRALWERRRYRCRLRLAEIYGQQGRLERAESILNNLLRDDPFDEDVICRLMSLLQQQGLTHQALVVYRQACTLFEEEGMELTEATRELTERIGRERQTPSAKRILSGNFDLLLSVESEGQRLFRPTEHITLLAVQLGIASPDLENPTVWFGERLAHLLTIVEEYWGEPTFCQELQEKIGKELNSMQPKVDAQGYTLSRRQLLITLATLPTTLLLTMLQGQRSAGRIEQFLTRCAASLVACWHLMRGCEYAVVEELLPTYLPLLASLAQESSKYQSTAASLATQSYRLKGILALHRNNANARDAYFQQAVYYAEIAQHPGLLVAALISLAYHQPNPRDAEQMYQRAMVYEQTISPLQRSRLYVELSVTYAQQNREDEAVQYLRLAAQEYPVCPEDDPSFLYAEFSPSSMILEKGRVHLALTQYQPDGPYSKRAWEIFAGVGTGPSKLIISERIRYEIVNYQAETALALRDRDLCCDYLEQGARGAAVLGSAKRRKEVLVIRSKALKLWPHDGRVKELKYLFA